MPTLFRVVPSQLPMVEQLAMVQQEAFPSLAPAERITATHYAAHIRRFPQGQFAVVGPAGEVVACSTDFRTSAIDWQHYEHRYWDAVAHNWLDHHDPQGEWLYGADIGVKPAYRGRGLSSLLYATRQELIRRLNLRGHVAGGLLAGYGAYKATMTAEAYVRKVIAAEIWDPTLSVQLKRGFRVHGIIQQYVDDPGCDGKAAFLVWPNPAYDPTRPVVIT